MARTAADIAQTKVSTLSPETPLVNAHRVFVDEQISGAPVVDDLGRVIGVVSGADLMRAVVEMHDTAREEPIYFHDGLELSMGDWQNLPADFQNRLQAIVVGDVMTDSLVTVDAAAPIRDVARRMCEEGVHRVIVVKEDLLVGIISTLDLARLIAEGDDID